MYSLLVVLHVAAGTIGLLLAWPTLLAPKRRGVHPVLGRIYAVATVILCLTAFALVAYHPAELWGLAILGVLTLGWVAGGVWFARVKPRMRGRLNWRVWHLNLMGSSVIGFVTAFVVQMTGGHVLAWAVPTLLGSPLIAWRTRRELIRRAPRTIAVTAPT